jgi:hypothetical protein
VLAGAAAHPCYLLLQKVYFQQSANPGILSCTAVKIIFRLFYHSPRLAHATMAFLPFKYSHFLNPVYFTKNRGYSTPLLNGKVRTIAQARVVGENSNNEVGQALFVKQGHFTHSA